jgi:hypothetical protein
MYLVFLDVPGSGEAILRRSAPVTEVAETGIL